MTQFTRSYYTDAQWAIREVAVAAFNTWDKERSQNNLRQIEDHFARRLQDNSSKLSRSGSFSRVGPYTHLQGVRTVMYKVLTNNHPVSPESGVSLDEAKVMAMDVVFSLIEGDFFHYIKAAHRDDGSFSLTVFHHNEADEIDIVEAK